MKKQTDWRSIGNEKEKYAAYLCSREWSVLKEAVKERSGGTCERCRVLPGDAVHHLNYERKYNESLEDLQHNCNACHEFTHAKSNFDPVNNQWWLHYVRDCITNDENPVPFSLACVGVAFSNDDDMGVCDGVRGCVRVMAELNELRGKLMDDGAIENSESIAWHSFMAVTVAMRAIDKKLGFVLSSWFIQGHGRITRELYDFSLSVKWPKD